MSRGKRSSAPGHSRTDRRLGQRRKKKRTKPVVPQTQTTQVINSSEVGFAVCLNPKCLYIHDVWGPRAAKGPCPRCRFIRIYTQDRALFDHARVINKLFN